ncbi:MAG: undecaprenyl-diphosphatase UppP [Candidatus Binataceae bacterium]
MFVGIHDVILGILQGLTEFLPVSSSAHLAIVPWLFGWKDQGLAFDVALHLGTLLALLIYYGKDWIAMLSSVVKGGREERRLLLFLIVASIPGAIFGLLFEKQAETIFRSPLLIACTMTALGLLLSIADRSKKLRRTFNDITLGDAFLIGLSQAFAIIPGVSRSGVTITTALALKVRREDAANFSFLMATPIIAGAGLIKAHELVSNGLDSALAAGFIASAVFGLLAISMLINYVRRRSYQPFVWYRIAFAIIVVIAYLAKG